MAEPITAVFHYKRLRSGEGGTEAEEGRVKNVYSVKDYIIAYEQIQDRFDASTTALVRALADYGHYVQPVLARTNNWTIGKEYKAMDKYYTEQFDYDAVAKAVAGYAGSYDIGNSGFSDMMFALNLLARTKFRVFLYFEKMKILE